MHQRIVKHLPLITNHIEFLEVRSQAPFVYAPTLITPRINFGQGQGPILPVGSLDNDSSPPLQRLRKTRRHRETSAACYVRHKSHVEDMASEGSQAEEIVNDTYIHAKMLNSAGQNNGTCSDTNDDSADTPSIVNPNEDSDSDQSDDTTPELRAGKIPKPRGEPGRPGYGGYTLATELKGWTNDDYAEVNKYVKAEANALLNTRLSYNKQVESKLVQLCSKAKQRFPILDKYDAEWPVRDLLKLHLKYTSGQHRNAIRMQGGKVEQGNKIKQGIKQRKTID